MSRPRGRRRDGRDHLARLMVEQPCLPGPTRYGRVKAGGAGLCGAWQSRVVLAFLSRLFFCEVFTSP